MGWFIAWIVVALGIGLGVVGVRLPILYGFFISTILVGGVWLFCRFVDALFGRKR